MNIIPRFLPHNFAKGRNGQWPKAIVIHVGDGSFQAIYQEFLNPATEKSSHYCVDFDGTVYQFVDERNTAWANGTVVRPTAELVKTTLTNPNLWTISIEHAGYGRNNFTEAQYQATGELVKSICLRWNIPIERRYILRHSEIRANKTCPGVADVGRIVELANAPASMPIKESEKTPDVDTRPAFLRWFSEKIQGK